MNILERLADSVVRFDENAAVELSHEAIESGISAYTSISEGLAKGMVTMGQRYDRGVVFVPELLLASDAMYAGMEVLKPYIETRNDDRNFHGVIGVIEGDTHDIGKNLVKIMFEADGFEMTDLGRDVSPDRFVETAVNDRADIICISSLMTTAMTGMGAVITLLSHEGIRDRFKVMVGGACISAVFAGRIGADGYAPTAAAAVKQARLLLRIVDDE